MIHVRVLGCSTLLKGHTVAGLRDDQPACCLPGGSSCNDSHAYSRNYCPGPSDGNMNERTQLVLCAMDSLLFALVFAFTFVAFVVGYRCCSKLC